MKRNIFRDFRFRFQKRLLQKLDAGLITYLQLDTFDPNHKHVSHFEKVGQSLLGNFLATLYAQMCAGDQTNYNQIGWPNGTQSQQVKNVAGTGSTSGNSVMNLDAPAANTNYGIVFGTGSTTPTPINYQLGALIANGSGAGQLTYQPSGALQGIVVSGNNTSFILQRIAVNNSGASITITEVGIQYFNNSLTQYVEIYRDLTNQIVSASETVTCQITFQVTT